MNQYNEDSIQKLSPLEFTRLRPDTYCGSTEDSTQLIVELITNCKDEFLIGNCNEVHITINEKENIITVADSGQGIIPSLIKEDGKTVLEMVYGDINTSGKYDKSENAVYKESTGAFGIGASLSNFLSHWLTATTKRDGKFETVYFIEGKFDHREEGTCSKEEHGVIVSLNPSEEFFRDAKPNIKSLQQMLYNDSCVCPGLKYYLNEEEFYHPEGLKDLILKEKETELTNLFELNQEEGRQKLNLVLIYTPQTKTEIIPFCNYALIEAGTPITAIKSTLTRTLNKWAKEQGFLKEKDKNLEGTALQEGLKLAFNLSSPNVRYDSQTKVRVTSTEDNTFLSSSLSSAFEIWLDNNPADGQIIIERALVARKAAEAAKKARAAVKAKASAVPAKAKKAIDLPSKLADCFSTDRTKCEIYIVEGDSAGGNLKQVRNNEFQAVFPLRGKMLNTQKASLDKILKNAEIVNLIKAFGLQISSDGKRVVYNKNSIRYGKIIIMSDADVDGAHIKNLFYTFIWNFIPDLITDGFIYAGVPPLYRLRTNKEVFYLKDEKALEEFKSDHDLSKYHMSRLKGLGEMSPEETEEALVDPDTRIIKQIELEDVGKADSLFETLMGSSAEKRKKYIEENSEKAIIYV